MSSPEPPIPLEYIPYMQNPLTLDEVASHASQVLLRNGHHDTLLIVQTHQLPSLLMSLPEECETSQEREEWAYKLGQEIAQEESLGDLEQIFLISEMWSATGEKMPKKSLSEYPNHKELLSVFYRNVADNQPDWRSYEMIRNQQGSLNKIMPNKNGKDGLIVFDAILKPIIEGYQQGSSN